MGGNAYTDNGSAFAAVRYLSDGTLDSSFGNGGRAIYELSDWGYAYDMAVQSDSSVVIAGYTYNGNDYDFAVMRFSAAGIVDTNFGDEGLVTYDFAGSYDFARGIQVQADDRIIIAGNARTGADWNSCDFGLIRLESDGSLDQSFGTAGRATTDFAGGYDYAHHVHVQSDGKILAAGSALGADNDFALVRYHVDGSLDTSFGAGGRITYDFGGWEYAYDVTQRADGGVYVVGYSGSRDYTVLALNADGAVDTGFATEGVANIDFDQGWDSAYAVPEWFPNGQASLGRISAFSTPSRVKRNNKSNRVRNNLLGPSRTRTVASGSRSPKGQPHGMTIPNI